MARTIVLEKLQSSEESVDVIEIQLEPNWNGCSLFGVLLGFPCVYTYDTNNGENNCLSYLDLVQIQGFQYNKPVASFTVPQQIYDEYPILKEAIENWKGKFHESKQEVVIFPSVVM